MAGVMQRQRSGRGVEDKADEQTKTESSRLGRIEQSAVDAVDGVRSTTYVGEQIRELRDSGDWAESSTLQDTEKHISSNMKK